MYYTISFQNNFSLSLTYKEHTSVIYLCITQKHSKILSLSLAYKEHTSVICPCITQNHSKILSFSPSPIKNTLPLGATWLVHPRGSISSLLLVVWFWGCGDENVFFYQLCFLPCVLQVILLKLVEIHTDDMLGRSLSMDKIKI